MSEPQPDTACTPVPARSWPEWRKLAAAMLVTVLVVALPRVGAVVGYWQTGEPIERDLVRQATWIAAGVCALAWAGFGWARFGPRPRRLRAFRGKSAEVADPELVRALLNEHELTCAGCGYNLKGLKSDLCPECRAPVSLRVSSADCSRTEALALTWLIALYALSTAMYALFLISWLHAAFSQRPAYGLVSPVVMVLGLVPITAMMASWFLSRDYSIRAAARARAALTTVTLLTFSFGWDLFRNLFHLW